MPGASGITGRERRAGRLAHEQTRADVRVDVHVHRQWTPLARGLSATGDRWTLLIVLALARSPARLSVLRERLPGVSSGVLDHHVREMARLGLLTRRRFRELPPRVELELTPAGMELEPIAEALARWALRNRWSEPREGEQVQAAALLHQLPALVDDAKRLPDGVLEARLLAREGIERCCIQIEDGHARAIAAPPEPPGERAEGDQAAWLAALGPTHDFGGLVFKGRRRLGRRLLEALADAGAQRPRR